MSNNVKFEGFDRRIEKIKACMAENGIADLEEAKAICEEKGINVDEMAAPNVISSSCNGILDAVKNVVASNPVP